MFITLIATIVILVTLIVLLERRVRKLEDFQNNMPFSTPRAYKELRKFTRAWKGRVTK